MVFNSPEISPESHNMNISHTNNNAEYIMRATTFLMVFLMINSCGISKEKADQKDESIKQEYLLKGAEIVNLTQSELLTNVSHAMKLGGPEYAIDFCNLRAMRIKDSLSLLHNCQIRRIAIKYRNPLDKPRTKTEEDQLYAYRDAGEKGEPSKPKVFLFDDRIEYYHPIYINNGACLMCHGDPDTQIVEQAMDRIRAHYPDDLATGFAMNDFRGAWKITFITQ